MTPYISIACLCFIFILAASGDTRASFNGLNWVGGKRGEPILKGPEQPRDVQIDLAADVHFILFTKSNINAGRRIYLGDIDGLQKSGFNGNNPTKFLIHGWTDDLNCALIQKSKNAYLSVGSYNVIGVDWGELAKPILYTEAKANVIPVGNYVGDMINFLNSAGGSANSRTHLIGHSLGGHVAGNAGARATGTVARVTGLDPALPLYSDDPDSARLDPSDAAFVDVIHTSAGKQGFKGTRGHADFYPNGGDSPQPGCGTDTVGGCSHAKCVELFVASILNHAAFPAHKCSTVDDADLGNCDAATTGYMGDGASTSMRGIFWMATN